ncbi:septation protein SepH [Nocardioides sp. SYSU DS0663]|uniref:septation protein SepH n=1 Tax=Nocardioides sp. SYSU DS0663 TaxID=3416445 RepID=UPI003F4C5700
MAHLELTGVSEDGKRLLLTDETGTEHDVVIDQRLRDALREKSASGTSPRDQPSRRMEKQMESTLRPRDIQARVRAGESAERLAEIAGTSVERIMAFAGPVLAERQHVAQRAQRSSVRRRAGESAGSARTLGEAVEGRLRALNVVPDVVEWDSWRREDGRWTLVADYETRERQGRAELAFDVPGNFVVPENDDARWLVGEPLAEAVDIAPTSEPAAQARDDLRQARERRRTTVDPVDQELPYDQPADELGVDAIQLVRDRSAEPEPGPHHEVEVEVDPEAPTAEQPAVPAGDEPAPDDAVQPQPAAEEPPARRPVRKSRGRASVPSWDEIMFGGGKPD